VAFVALGLLVLPGVVHSFRNLFKDFMCLKPQIRGFSCRSANCFCCTVGHVHPNTRATIPCDRNLVYNTLTKCFPAGPESLESGKTALDQFDEKVREQFRQVFEARNAILLAYRYSLVISSPFVWRFIDISGSLHQLPAFVAVRLIAHHAVLAFATIPIGVKLFVWLLTGFHKIIGVPTLRVLDLLATCTLVLVCLAAFAAILRPLQRALGEKDPSAQITFDSVSLLLVLLCYCRPKCFPRCLEGAALRNISFFHVGQGAEVDST